MANVYRYNTQESTIHVFDNPKWEEDIGYLWVFP